MFLTRHWVLSRYILRHRYKHASWDSMCHKVVFPSIKWQILIPNDINKLQTKICSKGNGEGGSWEKARENLVKLVIWVICGWHFITPWVDGSAGLIPQKVSYEAGMVLYVWKQNINKGQCDNMIYSNTMLLWAIFHFRINGRHFVFLFRFFYINLIWHVSLLLLFRDERKQFICPSWPYLAGHECRDLQQKSIG